MENKLHPPIDNLVLSKHPQGDVTQWFAENPDLYRRWGLKYHNGIDIVAPHGTPMFAVEDARVVDIKHNPDGYGKHIRIRARRKDDEGRYRCWTYAHCSQIHAKLGDYVDTGEHIADMGNTGFVVSGATPWWEHNPYAGTHLHLGLRLLIEDDRGWMYSGDNIRIEVENYDNGVKGAIDPYPYLAHLSEDERNIRSRFRTIHSLLLTLKNRLST